MFSLKDSIRKTITLTLAAAMATTVFVGFSNTKEPVDSNTSTTAITSELTPGIPDNGTEESENPAIVFSNTLFHWVEEPLGADLAMNVADFLESKEVEVDDTSVVYGLPVLVAENTKYLHSGNLMLELTEDGDFANKEDTELVRYTHEPDTASGAKIYIYKSDNTKYISQMSLTEDEELISRTDKFWNTLEGEVPTDHGEYIISNVLADSAVEIPENALVWYNGIATDIRAQAGLIPLEVLTSDFTNILSYEKTDTGYTFTLYTGIGAVKIDATLSNASWLFTYTLPENVTDTHDSVTLPAAEMSDASGNLCVSSKVLNDVFNYFVFSFSSVDMDDGSTEDIAVVITDNQDILYSNKAERDKISELEEEADKLAEEQQAAIEAPEQTPEEAAADKKDREERQDAADKYQQEIKDNPSKAPEKTTTDGSLTEPVTSVPGVDNTGKNTKFTGDPSTALTTTLPEGCYWSPSKKYPNAYTDAAGNLWVNNQRPSDPAKDTNQNAGYYDPYGKYHFTQEEHEYAEALNQAITDRHNGNTTFDPSVTDEDLKELDDLLASLL